MSYFWTEFLYRPLLNLLIYLYDTVALGNLGLAVVWLSVLVRVALLPLSVIIERNKSIFEALSNKLQKIQDDFNKDPVLGREMTRRLLKKYKIRPLANVLLLGTQLLILVLLYQVFIGGINLSPEYLYPSVKKPTTIDTTFLGIFDIAQSNFIFSLIVSVALFWTIRTEYVGKQYLVNTRNAFYLYAFPIFTLVALWLLPSVKALFIFTSMVFSYAIHYAQQPIYEMVFAKRLAKIRQETSLPISVEPKKQTMFSGNPWDQLRVKKRS